MKEMREEYSREVLEIAMQMIIGIILPRSLVCPMGLVSCPNSAAHFCGASARKKDTERFVLSNSFKRVFSQSLILIWPDFNLFLSLTNHISCVNVGGSIAQNGQLKSARTARSL